MIGYFPTYTLGNLMAAQLWSALSAQLPEIEADIAAGRFGPLREWLRENIHRHGRKFDSRELLRRATGEELSVEPWLAYLEGKLLDAGLLSGPVRVPRS
jgi:carboxypeptidase Taq